MIVGGSLGRKGARPHHVCPQGVALSELRATPQPLRSTSGCLAWGGYFIHTNQTSLKFQGRGLCFVSFGSVVHDFLYLPFFCKTKLCTE